MKHSMFLSHRRKLKVNISNPELQKEEEVNSSNQKLPGRGASVYPSFKTHEKANNLFHRLPETELGDA